MTTAIIISLCILVLLAYLFDITASRTRIPSVILLLATGWLVRQGAEKFSVYLPDLSPILPVLGTVGLIMIVLEGSLELELNRSKGPMIRKSFILALIPLLVLAFGLSYVLQYFGEDRFKDNLVNTIPLCVISSAIAIPTARSLVKTNREVVVYESSFSDILGVLFFNFIALNAVINIQTFGIFILQILLIVLISFVSTIGLSFLLNRIEHHIKFVPIVMLVILIYAISKIYHLPGLIFIMVFGLFLGNLDELKHVKWIARLRPDELDAQVRVFKDLIAEGTFLVRISFFILFGFLIDTHELQNPNTLLWSVGIVAAIHVVRAIQLLITGLPMMPLVFIAPRGLISILLFLSIAPENRVPLVNDSLLIQVVVLSALMMMLGMMFSKRDKSDTENIVHNSHV
ncbi:MAG TPA: sodium:proton antiporter [Chitinophagaceae bacterium]|nr:sodium:proton antiporter [Chitinophagaceae bacterium]